MYDPVTKEAMIVRFERIIKVPGKFADYLEALEASRKVLREKYPELSD